MNAGFAAVARIARGVDVPVAADIEAGYGLEPKELVDRLLAAGVVGCNLEDSDPATRALVDAERQADRLAAVRDAAGDALVINARVDVFLAGGNISEAIARGRRYREAGADCVYPIFATLDVLPDLVSGIDAPINVHHRQGGPSPTELGTLGASRITFGGDLHTRTTDYLRTLATELTSDVPGHPDQPPATIGPAGHARGTAVSGAPIQSTVRCPSQNREISAGSCRAS